MIITILLTGIVLFLQFYGYLPVPLLLLLDTVLCTALFLYLKRHRHNHGGFLSIDYYAQTSRLNKVHPAPKILVVFIAIAFCLGTKSFLLPTFVLVTMFLFSVPLGGIPISYYLSLLLVPATFIILSGLAILVQFSSTPLGFLDIPAPGFYLSVTQTSQATSLLVLARAFASVSCLYMLSLSTPIHEMIAFLNKIHLPSILIELMYLIYRYIFVLLDLQNSMSQAASSRLGYHNHKIWLKTILLTASNLMRLSFKQASASYDAMEARCYDGTLAFFIKKKAIRPVDILASCIYCALLLVIRLFCAR